MRNFITNSTAFYKAGISPGKKIFRINSGPYAGRLAMLMATSANNIQITYADYPYNVWAVPETMIYDSADYPFDAVMNSTGDIYLAYTLESSHALVLRKLTFSLGGWHAGTLRTIYNVSGCYFPSILIESPEMLWVSYTRQSDSQFIVNAKSSEDDGETWMGGPEDFGWLIGGPYDSAYSRIIIFGAFLDAVYTVDGSKLALRRKHLTTPVWNTEQEVASGAGFDSDFDVALSENGRMGIVFDDGQLKFREYDGSGWTGISTVDENGGSFPQIRYFDNNPYVVYMSAVGDNQNKMLYSRRVAGSFTDPVILDARKNAFAKVLCFHAGSGTYEDLTSAAADETAGDVLHSESSSLAANIGDAVYLGMDDKFNYLKLILSTAGSGGGIEWQYFNGQDWTGFVPYGGTYSFDSLDKELLLWRDYASIVGDWQKKDVAGHYHFWIRALVSSQFNAGPVGTRLTAIPGTCAVQILEQ